jgi:hypothetical protein
MEVPQRERKPAILTLLKDLWPYVLIPLVIGLPFLLIGLSEAFKSLQLERSWISTRGTVVDNYWEAFAQGGAAYVPVVDFETLDGQTVRITDGIGSIPPDYAVGTEVQVLYDPDDIRKARVVSWKRLWFAPTLITCVGLLPVLVAVVVICVVALGARSSRRLAP